MVHFLGPWQYPVAAQGGGGVQGGGAVPARSGLGPVEPLCSCSSSSSRLPQVSSVFSKGCLAKKLWTGKWCHHDNLFHTSPSQLSESAPLLGTWMTSPLRQGRCLHNSVPTVFDKVLSKVCRTSEVLLWFQCSTIPLVLQLSVRMCLIQLCPPLLPWKSTASLEENFSPSPLADNFMDLLLSRYVLYASVVRILYKASKVELLNKHPNVEPMCFHGWLHMDFFFFFKSLFTGHSVLYPLPMLALLQKSQNLLLMLFV